MEEQEYKDELSKDENEEHLLVRSTKSNMQNCAKVGFLIALIPFAIRMFLSFIYEGLISIGGKALEWLYEISGYYSAIMQLSCFVGAIGLVISAVGYKKSAKDDTVSKKFSAVGITLGAIHAWGLVSTLIYTIINNIAAA